MTCNKMKKPTVPGPVVIAAGIVCIAFFLFHSVFSAKMNSITADEYVHLPVAISILQTGNMFIDHTGSPPLRALAGIPALMSAPVMDYDNSFWREGKTYKFSWLFMKNNFSRYHSLYFLPRLLISGFAVLLGLLVFLHTKRLWGWSAVPFAFLLFFFNPEILAHGALVTVDLLVACFFLRRFIFSFFFYAGPHGFTACCAASPWGLLFSLNSLPLYSRLS